MTTYIIKRNGDIVQHIVFEGDTTKNHIRTSSIIDLTFDNKKTALEVANKLNATIVEVA